MIVFHFPIRHALAIGGDCDNRMMTPERVDTRRKSFRSLGLNAEGTDMDFPNTDRVVYAQNPLAEVVCEFRFPRILSLDENLPAEFQNAVSSEYPFVEIKKVMQFSPGENSAPNIGTHYQFLNEDRSVTITVCSEYISISTTAYARWEIFLEHIKAGLNALRKAYPVSRFTRIGLRYIDVISRSKLNLNDVPWSELIKHSALGILAEPEIPLADTEAIMSMTTLKIDGGRVTLRYGLTNPEQTENELKFVVDSDFFCDDAIKEDANALDILNRFNGAAGRTFRWFILPTLHDALQPKTP